MDATLFCYVHYSMSCQVQTIGVLSVWGKSQHFVYPFTGKLN